MKLSKPRKIKEQKVDFTKFLIIINFLSLSIAFINPFVYVTQYSNYESNFDIVFVRETFYFSKQYVTMYYYCSRFLFEYF